MSGRRARLVAALAVVLTAGCGGVDTQLDAADAVPGPVTPRQPGQDGSRGTAAGSGAGSGAVGSEAGAGGEAFRLGRCPSYGSMVGTVAWDTVDAAPPKTPKAAIAR